MLTLHPVPAYQADMSPVQSNPTSPPALPPDIPTFGELKQLHLPVEKTAKIPGDVTIPETTPSPSQPPQTSAEQSGSQPAPNVLTDSNTDLKLSKFSTPDAIATPGATLQRTTTSSSTVSMSSAGISFLKRCFMMAKERPSASDLLEDPWLKKAEKAVQEFRELTSNHSSPYPNPWFGISIQHSQGHFSPGWGNSSKNSMGSYFPTFTTTNSASPSLK
jgi:hypothetical protein